LVYDLGSGDGRLLFTALEKGAGKTVGVELDPVHAREARETARKKGLEDKVTFLEADVMEVSLAEATVILCYLSAGASGTLRPKFESELKPGTKVVMESCPVLEWKPTQVTYKDYKYFYLYVMPPEITERDQQNGVGYDYFADYDA
jgi:ribosomal protein L11 methylase PrmA